MDDFYIICESKQRLQEALVVIRQHLAERGLELNKRQTSSRCATAWTSWASTPTSTTPGV